MTMADEGVSLGPDDLKPPNEDSPSVQDLEQLLNTGRSSCHHTDEVWPNLFLGDQIYTQGFDYTWRQNLCPLCFWDKQVLLFGAGVPHDLSSFLVG
ncbi:dual specificity protein phosphatase 13 isoform X2 [Crotalus tigris]|uniref:dual specificity protein phosphatase 13 isoform X2 n=1 Tax=Crotalus tigris TaxID=88082 RepID=UPI00192FB3AF|nr:dual specificity protein phosphatase 13 isoform X2 [Crotalus tigris]